jgi:ribosome-binding factor A
MVNDIRLRRLEEVIKQRASEVILFELKDPRLGFLTVTRVKLARDLTTCVVYWSVVGTAGERSKTEHALESSRAYLQRAIAKALQTRQTPVVHLRYDESMLRAAKVHDILKRLREERGENAPGDAAEAEARVAADEAKGGAGDDGSEE